MQTLIYLKWQSCKFIIILDSVLAFKKIWNLIRESLFKEHVFFIGEFFLDLNSMLFLEFWRQLWTAWQWTDYG